MKRFQVSFEVIIANGDPPDWILHDLCENLGTGEDVEEFSIREIKPQDDHGTNESNCQYGDKG